MQSKKAASTYLSETIAADTRSKEARICKKKGEGGALLPLEGKRGLDVADAVAASLRIREAALRVADMGARRRSGAANARRDTCATRDIAFS